MPKNPHADFSPVLDGYSGIGAFRFWCQTALPLTYDDSLSYYELLNKVVNYLNHTIEDLTAVESNTSALANAYNQLQKYVNDYFDDLDVEAELRNVLDAMAEDGTLDALLSPIVENQLPGVVDEKIDAVVAEQIDGAVGRHIDESVADQLPNVVETQLPNVVDDKIDAVVAEQIDGAVAGQIDESVADQLPPVVAEAIPSEVTDWLNDNVDPVGSAVMVDSSLTIGGAAADAKVTGDELSDLKTQVGDSALTFVCTDEYAVNNAGNLDPSATSCATDFIAVIPGQIIKFTNLFLTNARRLCAYDANKEHPTVIAGGTDITEYTYVVPDNVAFVRATGKKGIPVNADYVNLSAELQTVNANVNDLLKDVEENEEEIANVSDQFNIVKTNLYLYGTTNNPIAYTTQNGYASKNSSNVWKLGNLSHASWLMNIYPVEANKEYFIGVETSISNENVATVFFTTEITLNNPVDMIRAGVPENVKTSYTPTSNGYIGVLVQSGANIVGKNIVVGEIAYKDFEKEIEENAIRYADSNWLQGTPEIYGSLRIHNRLGKVKGTINILEDDGKKLAVCVYSTSGYTTKTYDSGWVREGFSVNVDGYVVIVAGMNDLTAEIHPDDGKDLSVGVLELISLQLDSIRNDITNINDNIGSMWNYGSEHSFKAIAHQGGKGVVPPCTLPAVKFAKSQGFRATENDLRKTSDGVWVMWHDDTLSVCGYPNVTVEGSTYAEISQYDVGSYISSEFAGTHICTFKEWLVLCKELGMEPWIDCKAVIDENDAIELFAIVRRLGMARNVVWVGRTRIVKTYADEYAVVAILDNPTAQNITSLAGFISDGDDPKCSFDVQLSQLDSTQMENAFDAGYNVGAWWDNVYTLSESEVLAAVKPWIAKGIQYITLNNVNIEKLLVEQS